MAVMIREFYIILQLKSGCEMISSAADSTAVHRTNVELLKEEKQVRKEIGMLIACMLTGSLFAAGVCAADDAQYDQKAYLAFEAGGMEITNGTLSWNSETAEWQAAYPTMYGDMLLGGTISENGTLTLTEDNSGGHGDAYMEPIQEVFSSVMNGEKTAPLTFDLDGMNIIGGELNWNEADSTWEAAFPTPYGDMIIGGDYAEDGTLNVTQDNSFGHADAWLPPIQEVFLEALSGEFREAKTLENELPDNGLSEEIDSYETENSWKRIVTDIAREYDPEDPGNQNNTIFYGASNFWYWETMKEDLQPYAVQNHAFGGSTDKDLREFAQFMLYPYNPQIVFFQTGSNDYVDSEAETDEAKVEEAMSFKKEMFAEFHEQLPDATFVVMSGILLPGRSEYVDMTLDINDLLKAFCEENDYMIFADAESLTYDREAGSFVENVESLFNDDLIHLTGDARITWANNWMLPILEELGAPLADTQEAADSAAAIVVESVEEAAA